MRSLCAFLLLSSLSVPRGIAQDHDVPKVAGTEVPVPKRTKTVQPDYPAEALAKGLRGIVILDLVIDGQGHIASADVIRSVPPFDEAALAAVRKWEYEVTRVEGKPVSVRLTVPITFAMKLPDITSRQEGIPELRQGAIPVYPSGASSREGASVVVEVALESDGQIGEAQVKNGEPPFSPALLLALRTWRFAPPGPGVVVSFKIEAQFIPEGKGGAGRVELHLSGLQRSEFAPAAASQETPAPSATPSPAPAPGPSPSPAAAAGTPAAAPSPAPTPAAPAPRATRGGERPRPTPTPSPSTASTEVIGSPATAALTTSPVSAVQDVTLAPGVPDLAKGRRPVVPPLARMGGLTGSVEVRFAVDAAGAASVQSSEGPDGLKAAAEQTVASWAFRRITPDRLYLTAVLTYGATTASAAVKPQEQQQP